MIPFTGWLIMMAVAGVIAIVGWCGHGAYVVSKLGYPACAGALMGLGGPKGIAHMKSTPPGKR